MSDYLVGEVDAVLRDVGGDEIGVVTDGGVRRLQTQAALTDAHGKNAQFSAFGLLKTAYESIVADYRFNEADGITDQFTPTVTGTGGYTFEAGGTGIKLSTGASASSKCTLVSNTVHHYQSGRGQLIKISIITGDTGVAGNIREWGYADEDNGILFRLDGTTLSLVVRDNGSETVVNASAWDTPVTLDANGHLFYVQFEWLGVGNFFIYHDEEIVHTYNFLGTSTNLSIGNPDLPIWFRNENTTNTSDVYLKCGCASVVTEGGMIISGQDINGRLQQCRVDSNGNLFVVQAASVQNLPKMINPYFDKSDGAIVANCFKRVMTHVIPEGFAGYLIRYTSWQNESAYSRMISETSMGTLEFVTDAFTTGDEYNTEMWAGTLELEVTTQLGATDNVTVTVTYTNQSGVGSRTGTVDISKNEIVGYRGVLELQAGDIGVHSIQDASVSPSGAAGAVKFLGFVQLAFHNDLSATVPTETNYNPGAVAFPTGTVLGFEYKGGTVNKHRIIEALIQLVED